MSDVKFESVDLEFERRIVRVIVPEWYEVTRQFETASWYQKLWVAPGEYATYYYWKDMPRSQEAFWRMPAIQVESYFVNRLFTASSVDHEKRLNKPDSWVGRVEHYLVRGKTEYGANTLVWETDEQVFDRLASARARQIASPPGPRYGGHSYPECMGCGIWHEVGADCIGVG